MQRYLTNTIIKIIQTKIIFFIFGFLLILINSIFAQNTNQIIKNDNLNESDSLKISTVKFKSPRTAMIRSLIFPGMGQGYNGKEFKALVFFCAEFGLLFNSIYLNQLYKRSTDEYVREFYIENRNLSTWWLVGVVLFSMLDAYVDAYLYNFDESPNLSIDYALSDEKKMIILSVSMSFKIGGF